MKNTKRYLALMTAGFLAITPMAATGLTAAASTLTVTDTETAAHTYTAYPIITGTKNADGSLTNIAWATGINSANLISALTTNATELDITISGTPSIDDVAEILAGITNANNIEKLAKILNTSSILGSDTGTPLTRSGNDYSATLADGWYLVVDTSPLTGDGKVDARSANLLQIVGDTTIDTKHSLPTLEKKIVSGESLVDVNTASIGDTVSYKITTAVPEMTGYEKYFFIVEDNLSAGLTYNESSLSVTYGTGAGTAFDLDSDNPTGNEDTGDYYVTVSGGNIKVVFEDFINTNLAEGTPITITYNATLNRNAVITDAGNTNQAKLYYSNDPNVSHTGKPSYPDEPDTDEVIGETPWDIVKTYTTAIKIKKVDTSGKVLEGAGFTLTGVSSGQALVIKNTFTEDASGDYWKLKDGTFTTTDPEGSGVDSSTYESTTQKYALTTSTELKGTGQTDTTIASMVGTDGCIVFQGLGVGSYTLTESTVPTGYNSIAPINFTIAAAPDESSAHWTTPTGFSAEGNMFVKTIENRKGSILPTTGGIGTKLFYIFGGLLVAGSVIFFVTKKRMSTKEN